MNYPASGRYSAEFVNGTISPAIQEKPRKEQQLPANFYFPGAWIPSEL
jgi:hypothetical protein